jgi:two-component SAPR family response regulator
MSNMNCFELYDEIKKIDDKVKVCFISAYEVDYAALGEPFPSLESDGIFPNNIIRKPIDVSKLIKRIELEL